MAFSNGTEKTADLGDNLRGRGSTDFKILQQKKIVDASKKKLKQE